VNSRGRQWLVFAAILGITLVLAFTVAGGRERYTRSRAASSYNPSPEGTKATFVTLEKLGWRIERWEHPWTKLASREGVLVFTDLSSDELYGGHGALPPTREETVALARWVAHGNTLLFYANPDQPLRRSTRELLDEMHIQLQTNSVANAEHRGVWELTRTAQTFHRITPFDVTRAVRSMEGEQNPGFRIVEGPVVPLVVSDEGAVHALWAPQGRGQVVVFSSASFIDNQFVAANDNLALLLNLLHELPAGGVVLFDEYHHGYSSEFAMHDFLGLPAVRFAVLQLALVVGLLLYSQARRFGEPVPLVVETRRSVLEYAVALGDLYRRADTQLETIDYLYQHTRRELIDRHGLRADATTAEIAARLASRAELRRQWEGLAKECEQRLETQRLTRREFGKLARRLQEFRRQMQ
jgi:hypothetical protein